MQASLVAFLAHGNVFPVHLLFTVYSCMPLSDMLYNGTTCNYIDLSLAHSRTSFITIACAYVFSIFKSKQSIQIVLIIEAISRHKLHGC